MVLAGALLTGTVLVGDWLVGDWLGSAFGVGDWLAVVELPNDCFSE